MIACCLHLVGGFNRNPPSCLYLRDSRHIYFHRLPVQCTGTVYILFVLICKQATPGQVDVLLTTQLSADLKHRTLSMNQKSQYFYRGRIQNLCWTWMWIQYVSKWVHWDELVHEWARLWFMINVSSHLVIVNDKSTCKSCNWVTTLAQLLYLVLHKSCTIVLHKSCTKVLHKSCTSLAQLLYHGF